MSRHTADGNLLLESLQDEHTYDAQSMFANAGFTICWGYCSSSAYASAGLGQVNSHYKSVTDQTGIWAGVSGFDIYVGKNTTLKGAVIGSDQRAVDENLNHLSTGTLVMEDIENVAKYDALQVSVGAGSGGSGGIGGGDGGMATPGSALAFDENIPQPERDQAAARAKAMRDDWGLGGRYRQVLGAILAGMSGNVAANGAQMLQNATVAYIQGLAASGVKDLADAMGKGPKAEVARAALHTIVGCAGAVANQGSCGAGALGAGASSILNSLGDEIRRREAENHQGDAKSGDKGKPMTASAQEAWRNTVATFVTGIATASGSNPATAMSAAIIETENNYLNASETSERVAAERRLKQCRDAACRDAEKAQLNRLSKINEGRNDRVETLPEDKSVYSAVLRGIEQDMAGLAVMANSSNRDEAEAAGTQLKQAGSKYKTVLREQQQLASRQDKVVRNEQLVEYGYLTEQQAKVLEKRTPEFVEELISKFEKVAEAAVGAGAGVVKGAATVAKKTATASKTGNATSAPSTANYVVEDGASLPLKRGREKTSEGGIQGASLPEGSQSIGGKAAGETTTQIPGRVQSRINIATWRTEATPLRETGQQVSAGFNHVLKGHFNIGVSNSRSVFTISPDELKKILQRSDVVRSPVTALPDDQFVRTVDVGKIIGITTLKEGATPTSVIKIFTDKAGNLITTFPINAVK